MPTVLNDFGAQVSWRGGENRSWRDRVPQAQVKRAQNMRVFADRLEKSPGYSSFATLPDDWAYDVTRKIAHIQGDRAFQPSNLWVCLDGSLNSEGFLAQIDIDGTVTDRSAGYSFDGLHLEWNGIILGGTHASPEAVLLSHGRLFNDDGGDPVGIINVASSAIVVWNTTLAFSGMAYWEGRLWGINPTDSLLIFSSVRSQWATDNDPDDSAGTWNYLQISSVSQAGSAVTSRFLIVLGQYLYVFTDRGIFRMEYVGGDDVYKQVMVTPEHGCQFHKGWVPIQNGQAVAFMDGKDIKVFNGVEVQELTNERNIGDELHAQTFDSASLAWDERKKILTICLYDADVSTSWGYDLHMEQYDEEAGTFAFSYQTWHTQIYSIQSVDMATLDSEYVVSGATATEDYWLDGYTLDTTFAGGDPLRYYGGVGDADTDAVLYKETPGTYLQATSAYESYVEPAPRDLSQFRRSGYPMVRRVQLDVSADGTMNLQLQHRDREQAYGNRLPLTLKDAEFQPKVVGVNRPGLYPGFKISDGGTQSVGWELRAIGYEGIVRGRR